MPQKVVIDTDFGTDAEDAIAVALAMALRRNRGSSVHRGGQTIRLPQTDAREFLVAPGQQLRDSTAALA